MDDQQVPGTKFRFKRKAREHVSSEDSHTSRHKRQRRRSDDEHPSFSEQRKRKRYSQSHSRRYPTSPSERQPSLSPETAFRESLFDAMADDEGAAFWEGVYGQPLHVYPDPTATSRADDDNNGQDNVHRMDDNEYAAYVRAKMWEKTHEGLLEEKRQREEAKQRNAAQEQERAELQRKIADSLKFGEERRRKKLWMDAWKTYKSRWERLISITVNTKQIEAMDEEFQIPWPTQSGRMTDVYKRGEVRRFFDKARENDESEISGASSNEEGAWLKKERIRWHPDKLQHRLGSAMAQGNKKDEVMSAVTAVFQILDDMWTSYSARRSKK